MPPQATARSPFAGCLILILALAMLIFLVGWATWLPFKQAGEMEKFTAAAPITLPTDPIEGNEPKVNDLVERLEAFRTELHGDATKPARIELSADDLNLAIAAFSPVQQLRGSFRVKEITADALVIDISYKLNGRPRLTKDGEEGFVTSDPRYLIGTLKGHPLLARKELALKVDSLAVPDGKTVADGFMQHFSTLRIFESYVKDPVLGPAMAGLTKVSLEDGKMVLARNPGENPPEVVSDAAFRQGGGRLITWLGIGACLFLAFAATMVFMGLRKQRKAAKTGETSPDDGGA